MNFLLKCSFFSTLICLSKIAAGDCLPSGTDADIQKLLTSGGRNAVVTLCQRSHFDLNKSISFTADGQHITTQNPTQGSSTADYRATLLIKSSSITTAISSGSFSNIHVSNLIVDGNSGALGYRSGSPLISLGGVGTFGISVENNKITNPRSQNALALNAGSFDPSLQCQKAFIYNNEIGPAGVLMDAPEGSLAANGINLSCRSSVIYGNTITDVSNAGIVLKSIGTIKSLWSIGTAVFYGSNGILESSILSINASVINGNTISAKTRALRYGIVLTEDGGYKGDYAADKESLADNSIQAEGAPIHIGLSIGGHSWTAGGPKGGNLDSSLSFNPKAGAYLFVGLGSSLSKGQSWKNNRLSLNLQKDDGNLVLINRLTNKVVWSMDAQIPNHWREGYRLQFQNDGNLVMYNSSKIPIWSSDTYGKNANQLVFQPDGNLVIYDAQHRSPWATHTNGK